MRSFTFLFAVIFVALPFAVLVVIDWVAPPRTVPKQGTPVATPTVVVDPDCAPEVDGICVTVNGQTIEIPGEVQVTQYSAGAVRTLNVAKNRRPSAVAGGNGVLLELKTTSGDDGIKESFGAGELNVAAFAVWSGNDFGYLSAVSQPEHAIGDLTLSPTDGRIVGSFEVELSGMKGNMRARADFNVPLPK